MKVISYKLDYFFYALLNISICLLAWSIDLWNLLVIGKTPNQSLDKSLSLLVFAQKLGSLLLKGAEKGVKRGWGGGGVWKKEGRRCKRKSPVYKHLRRKRAIIPKRKREKEGRKRERTGKGEEKSVVVCGTEMATPKQSYELQQQSNVQRVKNSGMISSNQSPMRDDKEEEMTRSALAMFRAKEEEIERKKMEVRDKVHAYLGRVEEETKRLAEIREELEGLNDPLRKEVAIVRKKIDSVNKELKPLGQTCQRKEREYKEALEAFNEKNKEKSQLVTKLMELVTESERLRMRKLEELSKNVDTLH
ncbi:hypothetical protein VNO77_36640 [Canavalia gladiata]|uniref:RAB6-interacting golgin n=1 Tax=Canavalia gladiata TaxID=3824 RepID=A0AAN9PWQ5_CANGL